MSKHSVRRFMPVLILSAVLAACSGKTNEPRAASGHRPKSVTARVFHQIRDVQIFAYGVPQAWEKAELSVPDSAVLIALLAEENSRVQKGDLLASLLTFNNDEGYVPVNLNAPINGVVTRIDYTIQAHIPAGRPIIEIKNFDHYVLRVRLASYQLDYIKRNTAAELQLNKARLKAHVSEIDRRRHEVLIITEPVAGLALNEDDFLLKISCPLIKGSYLRERLFGQSDSISVLLQDSIALQIYKVGRSDSLALIHPPLPDVQRLQIRTEKAGED